MKIERIDVIPLYYPLQGYFKFFDKSGKHPILAVKITADSGLAGWGESLPMPTWSYETPETAAHVLRQYFAPALIGRDPLDIEGCQQALDRSLAWSFSMAMPLARAGLDIALHDLVGKATGRSLAEMWGKPRGGPLTLSWTLNVRSLAEIDAAVETGRQRGYRNFNIKVAPDPKFDVAFAARVKQLVPDGFLWADANCGYDVSTALEVAPRLADVGVDVLEAPLRPHRISGYQALKRQGALPITMDEGVVSPVEAEEFIRLGMIDGLSMKISRCGGLTSARRQIELIEQAGLFWLGSGLTDPDLSLAATLALYGAYGLSKPAALNGPQFLADQILKTPLRIDGDQAYVPTGPGLGVEIDDARLERLMKP